MGLVFLAGARPLGLLLSIRDSLHVGLRSMAEGTAFDVRYLPRPSARKPKAGKLRTEAIPCGRLRRSD